MQVKTLGYEVDSARAKQRDNERAYKKKVREGRERENRERAIVKTWGCEGG